MTKLKVTLIRSTIGQTKYQKAAIKGLGLRKIGSFCILLDNKAIRGMINKVEHLILVQNIN